MKLPRAEPATPDEVADMLAVQCVADPGSPIVQGLDPETKARRSEQIGALRNEAETLDAFHTEPLPPGFVVIFTIDAQRRTIYSLRVPQGIDGESRLVSTNILVVLADAWQRYYTRWPDGVTPAAFEQLVAEPSVPRCYLQRMFWELALHHVAYTSAIHASNRVTNDHTRSETERKAALEMASSIEAIFASAEALRMSRLAHLTGAWDNDDPIRAITLFHEDPQTALPWIALFSRYMSATDPKAARWWADTSAHAMTMTASVEEAERRMAVAAGRAGTASFMMAMACAQELASDSSPSSQALAQISLDEAVRAAKRLDVLRLIQRPATGNCLVMPLAKRVLRKGSPRLFKILERQFERFGKLSKPPGDPR